MQKTIFKSRFIYYRCFLRTYLFLSSKTITKLKKSLSFNLPPALSNSIKNNIIKNNVYSIPAVYGYLKHLKHFTLIYKVLLCPNIPQHNHNLYIYSM